MMMKIVISLADHPVVADKAAAVVVVRVKAEALQPKRPAAANQNLHLAGKAVKNRRIVAVLAKGKN